VTTPQNLGKYYPDPQEETQRILKFLHNQEAIRRHNYNYYSGKVSYKLAINQFADMASISINKTIIGQSSSTVVGAGGEGV
jgi:hypothetical protein